MKRVFFATVAIAAMLTSCNQATSTTTQQSTPCVKNSVATSSELAYVNLDMVLALSDIYTSEGVALQSKTQKAQESWVKKEQGFQYEATQLQEKYQKGLITTANAKKEQESIEARMRTYQTTAQKEAQSLDEENVVFSNRTQDLIRRAVDEINVEKKYKMIINAATLIDADTTLDISNQVLEVVNRLYAADKK